MSLPKNSAASGMVYGIVVGGHDGDPAPDQSGNLRVYFPGLHGKDVDVKHLNFSPRMMSPTKSTQQEFPGGLDPGSLVIAMKDTGSSHCQIMGLANDTNLSDERIEGNSDLLQFIRSYMNQTINVNIPPNIKEVMENGARVRQVMEKGQKHNHSLFKGLPTHGALYQLAGAINPVVSNIPTAIQSFNMLMNDDIMSKIPGTVMSLGKMFGDLATEGLMKEINKAVPREVGYAIQSMGNLIQSIEPMEGAGFNVGGRVDPGSFLSAAATLLKQAQNLSDVVSALGRMQYDTSLFGLDKLANAVIDTEGVFGKMQLSISPTGVISQILPKETQAAISAASKLLSQFKSVDPSQTLFGKSSEQVFNMLDQLPGEIQKSMLEGLSKLNVAEDAQKLYGYVQKTMNGENPFA